MIGPEAIKALAFCLLAFCAAGCGGSGPSIPPADETQFSEDALILAAREATGPHIPADAAAQHDRDLTAIRAKYPAVKEVHAFPGFVLTDISVGLKLSAP